MIGYQHATPDAFDPLIHFNQQIDGYYVDGLSLTHGSPGSRQHIWTFAGAIGDMVLSDTYRCACSISHNWNFSTGFVGNDYFCDTGNHGNTWPHERFYSEDPLWDGAGCAPGTTCCQFNNPPWFSKTLPQPTTNDLEVRICHDGNVDDTPVQLLELYIQQ